jgi:hypothetical protein
MLGLRAASAWLSARLRRVDPRRVQTVFEDDGELVSGASTAVGFVGARGGEMLVMGLWDRPGALHCVDVDL